MYRLFCFIVKPVHYLPLFIGVSCRQLTRMDANHRIPIQVYYLANMDKRERQTNPQSPVQTSKRSKQHGKPRKTFFFQPQNTLAFNPQTSKNYSSESHDSSGFRDPNSGTELGTLSSHDQDYAAIINLDSDSTDDADPTRSSQVRYKASDKSMEQQSSDDSFDGVRWRHTASPNKSTRPIFSSPLKNTETAISLGSETARPVDNEVTDSVLEKYGVGLSKSIAEAPKCVRTRSEGPTMLLTSPQLARSKSFDPRSVESSYDKDSLNIALAMTSRLNTWIDKFEVHDEVKIHTKVSPNGLKRENTIVDSNELKNTETEQNDVSDDDDDPFSDDDSLLASIKPELFTQVNHILPTASTTPSTLASLTTANTSKQQKLLPIKKDLPTSDPFSDDLDFSVIEKVAVKPPLAEVRATDSFSKPTSQLATLRIDSFLEDAHEGAKISFDRPDFVRYQIKAVTRGAYPFKGFTRTQLILTVRDGNDSETRLIVRGDSAELDLQPNDIIHVILTSPDSPRLIDNTNNLIIWNPDILVSSTTVADQLFCPRKTVITKRFSFPGEASIPLIVGTTVHEIFQACFIMEKCTNEYLETLLDIELRKRIFEIYTMGDVLEDIKTKIRTHFPYIIQWFRSFYRTLPIPIPTNKQHQKIKFSVAEALDIEESVWSPMFGIKGIADVTLKANLEGDLSNGQFLLPMEIKTSRPYLSHQAQAALYSLLFKDRYNVDISSFLLVYTLDEGSTKKHDISVPDLKSLVNLRNRISTYLRPGFHELPDLMRQQKCDNCVIQQSCMTLNFLTEDGAAENSGLNEGVYEQLTEHLLEKPQYAAFYKSWDILLSKEEEFISRFNKDLWVLSAFEREKEQGKALANLVIARSSESENDTNGFLYTFKRNAPNQFGPMNATQISKYDKIIISDENGHFALAQGFVRHVESDYITVATRRRIIPTELKTDKFHRAGVLRHTQSLQPSHGDAVVFRIDKDEMFYGMGVARFNILNLFVLSGDIERRRLVVDLETPRYLEEPIILLENEKQEFNPDQVSAFRKALLAQDYSLILGMPGTGKTTVIAHLIKMLVEAKKTVLLTSYTNSAVDNILLKVKEYDIDILRIGNSSRIHKNILRYVPGEGSKVVKDFASFSEIYLKPYVVASTCLSIRDLAFNVRDHFDYCIIDEASQVSMPLSLGPLALCDKFILVGDHFQLPPLVTHPNPEIKKGLSRSLFQMLAEEHPQSVVELTYQYRMNQDIMLISNALVYQNRLKCGSEQVAGQELIIPQASQLSKHLNFGSEKKRLWLHHIFNRENNVIFLNHDKLEAYERSVGENISNLKEVELTRQIVEALCVCGVEESKIGVMTLYRSQLKLLVDSFRHRPQIEILTADRFQGRDKECIIISLVRSNKEQKTGELLKDWRRVNVAVTRARSKLVVLGSLGTLQNAESIRDFIGLVKRKGWVYDLDDSATEIYNFERPPKETQDSLSKTDFPKIGSKVIGRHPIVRDILSDMLIN